MIDPDESPEDWSRCLAVLRLALLLAPSTYLANLQTRLAEEGIQAAVARRETTVLFDWMVRLLARQGISNAAAEAFAERSGSPTWASISEKMGRSALCPRLRSYWRYAGCGYRRSTATCNSPHHLVSCPVATIPARKGALAEAAIAFRLFVHDVCDDDLVGWIDTRLAMADPGVGVPQRGVTMREAVLEPLTNIVGTGPKTWSMILAELLLGADLSRERWTTTGASFVAVDSLVHAYLYRTGILRRLQAEHPYGPACYGRGGCAEVIATLAERIDAREFNPTFPRVFPRWVQFAIWRFCAADGRSICHGNNIDDRVGCQQQFLPRLRGLRSTTDAGRAAWSSPGIRIGIKPNA